jgi:hypothetical protein
MYMSHGQHSKCSPALADELKIYNTSPGRSMSWSCRGDSASTRRKVMMSKDVPEYALFPLSQTRITGTYPGICGNGMLHMGRRHGREKGFRQASTLFYWCIDATHVLGLIGMYGRLGKDDQFRTTVNNVGPTAKQSWILHYSVRYTSFLRPMSSTHGILG